MAGVEGKTLKELSALVNGRLSGDPSALIKGVSSLEEAGPEDITFAADAGYLRLLKGSKAGAVIVKEGAEDEALKGRNVIFVKNPHLAFASVLSLFKPPAHPSPGVHRLAFVHPGAVVAKDSSIGPFAVIEEGAKVGERAVVYPGVYVGKGASIGEDSVMYSGVSIREGSIIGKRVIIHCNSVIGSDGFGYARDGSVHRKIPQTGIVRVSDDVEIGASVTIDRATVGETVIGRGTKIDNLVQIAHNVRVGEDCIIVAQVGIAGSTVIVDRVQIGGQAGFAGHIEVGDDVMIGAKAGVTKDVSAKGAFSGFPLLPHQEWLRCQGAFSRLPEILKRLNELEKRLKGLEEE